MENHLLEVYTKPQNNQYQNVQILTYQQSVFPVNFSGLTINLTDIFG